MKLLDLRILVLLLGGRDVFLASSAAGVRSHARGTPHSCSADSRWLRNGEFGRRHVLGLRRGSREAPVAARAIVRSLGDGHRHRVPAPHGLSAACLSFEKFTASSRSLATSCSLLQLQPCLLLSGLSELNCDRSVRSRTAWGRVHVLDGVTRLRVISDGHVVHFSRRACTWR